MATSNSKRGAHGKKRSKQWCERNGYPVCDMELVRIVHTLEGRFPTKRDQWGSDLHYLTKDAPVYLQCKAGGTPAHKFVAEAQKRFDDHAFPACARLEVHVWRAGARQPEVYPCQIKNIL